MAFLELQVLVLVGVTVAYAAWIASAFGFGSVVQAASSQGCVWGGRSVGWFDVGWFRRV